MKYGGYTAFLIPLPSIHCEGRSSFSSFVPHSGIIKPKSVVGVEPVDSGVVIGNQVVMSPAPGP